MSNKVPVLQNPIAIRPLSHYNARRIRPLAVSPLHHSERVPPPWGFLVLSRSAQEAA